MPNLPRKFFFGSTAMFNQKFDVHGDPEDVVIDFMESRVVDMSAIEALNKITERYHKVNKEVHLKHLSPDCRALLNNASEIIEVNVLEDPTYKVLADEIALSIVRVVISRFIVHFNNGGAVVNKALLL